MGLFSDEALLLRRLHSQFLFCYTISENRNGRFWKEGIKGKGKRRFERCCEVLVGGRFALASLTQLQRRWCISVLVHTQVIRTDMILLGRGVWARRKLRQVSSDGNHNTKHFCSEETSSRPLVMCRWYYRPLKTGFLFSAKALSASFRSSVFKTRSYKAFSLSSFGPS